jgi:hypothetical protein
MENLQSLHAGPVAQPGQNMAPSTPSCAVRTWEGHWPSGRRWMGLKLPTCWVQSVRQSCPLQSHALTRTCAAVHHQCHLICCKQSFL